jgi:hypothetical protein
VAHDDIDAYEPASRERPEAGFTSAAAKKCRHRQLRRRNDTHRGPLMTAAANQLGSVEHIVVLVLEDRSPRSTPPPSPPRGQATDSTSYGPSPLTRPPDVTFGQVPQQLLLGDTNAVISDHDTGKVS